LVYTDGVFSPSPPFHPTASGIKKGRSNDNTTTAHGSWDQLVDITLEGSEHYFDLVL
jgi:hypothetical protein